VLRLPTPPDLSSFPTRRSADLRRRSPEMHSLGRRSTTMQGPVSSGGSYLSRLLPRPFRLLALALGLASPASAQAPGTWAPMADRSEEHTAELQSPDQVVFRLLP